MVLGHFGLAAEMCVWDRCVGPGLGPVAAGPAVADVCGLLGVAVQRAKVCGLYDHILVDCQGKRLPWQPNLEVATGPEFVGYGHLDAKLTENRFPCQFQGNLLGSYNQNRDLSAPGPSRCRYTPAANPGSTGPTPQKLPITTYLTPTGRLPLIREISPPGPVLNQPTG